MTNLHVKYEDYEINVIEDNQRKPFGLLTDRHVTDRIETERQTLAKQYTPSWVFFEGGHKKDNIEKNIYVIFLRNKDLDIKWLLIEGILNTLYFLPSGFIMTTLPFLFREFWSPCHFSTKGIMIKEILIYSLQKTWVDLHNKNNLTLHNAQYLSKCKWGDNQVPKLCHIEGWERKGSKCFFTYIHCDLDL